MPEFKLLYKDSYRSEPLFPYARGMYWIFPAGFKRNVGKGSINETENYIIYFVKGTPEDIKTRLISDYAEYHKNHIHGID